MTGSPWTALDELAARQHGAFRLDQAAALGLSADTVRQRALREGWRRPHVGVFVLPGVPPGPWLAASAAVLAAGPRALLAGRTAAWLWELWRSTGRVE
ncbi:MAG: type IV toxin-antitoxin system AbiEi family antitoxin domain-containing protein, partial [Actinomycetota bacterium]|nr:type IV toxin-antitoxin system AbiEi family antitoxin domain-containing protein [Actinomycetota bacterium]